MLKHLELVGTFSILTMLWLIASADEVPLFEGCMCLGLYFLAAWHTADIILNYLGGGKHWKGSTTCVTGACCVEISIYHSMCLPDDPEHPKCRPIPPPPVAPLYGQCMPPQSLWFLLCYVR